MQPITPSFGLEVGWREADENAGFARELPSTRVARLRAALESADDALVATVRRAFDASGGVVVVRGLLGLSAGDFVALGALLGRVETAPRDGPFEAVLAHEPRVHEFSKVPSARVYDGAPAAAAGAASARYDPASGRPAWHTDQSFRAPPPKASALYCLSTPPDGSGATLFADMSAAYDALDAAQRALLPPLPYPSEPTDAYRSRLERVFAHAKSPENMMAAQALWDASMAHGLLRHLAEHPSHRVLHVCGRFHVEHFLGVVDQLWHYLYERPPSDAFRKLADDGVGERDAFRVVVCVPADFAAARADWAAVAREPMLAGLADFVVLTDVGKTAPGGVGPSGAAERAPECGGCPAA